VNKTSQDTKSLWLFFLIWPFGGFCFALKNVLNRNYHKIILAFSFLFGYSVYLYSGDIINYETSFHEVRTNYAWSDYFYLMTHVFSPDKLDHYIPNVVTRQPDVYAFSLQFFISRLTDNPRWFWAIVSVIYTAFFLTFITEIAKEVKWIDKNIAQKVFFIALLVVIPYYVGVTGVRFWTALFVFMIGAIRLVRNRQIKHLLYASLSILIHYSFFLPVAILIIYRLVRLRRDVRYVLVFGCMMFFVVSSTTSLLGFIENSLTFFSETTIEERISGYSDEEQLVGKQEKAAKANWYVKTRAEALLYFLLIITSLEAFGIIKFRNNEFLASMEPLIILFLCITLLTINLGSIGRFKNIFYLLSLSRYIILIGMMPLNHTLKLYSYILMPILLLWIIVTFRAGFYFTEPLLLVNNVFTTFVMHSEVSLSEFLVGH
jgi:hypothetical protein